MVNLTVLNSRQYCVVMDALDEAGKPRLGYRELRKGPQSFFLQPGMEVLYKHDHISIIFKACQSWRGGGGGGVIFYFCPSTL